LQAYMDDRAGQRSHAQAAAKAAGPPDRLGEFEITPEMIKAGTLVEWGICGDDIASDLACDLFKAMWGSRDPDPNLSRS